MRCGARGGGACDVNQNDSHLGFNPAKLYFNKTVTINNNNNNNNNKF